MRKPSFNWRKRTLFGVSALVMIGAGFWWLSVSESSLYGGRPLSYWMQQVEPDTGPDRLFPGFHFSQAGVVAVQEIGSSDMQTLLDLITKPQEGVGARILEWGENDRLPKAALDMLISASPTSYSPAMAIAILRVLGSEAKPAIPLLAQMLHVSDDAQWAALALCAIGPEGAAALEEELPKVNDPDVKTKVIYQLQFGIPKELEHQIAQFLALRLLEDPHAPVRMSAAQVIGTLTNSVEVAVPALINALQDPDNGVRFTASNSLKGLGGAASSATPALRALLRDPAVLKDPAPWIRNAASQAIRVIEEAQAEKLDAVD